MYILVLTFILGGCSASEVVQNWGAPPVADLSEPDYRRIVEKNIRGFFREEPPPDELEISGVRPIDLLTGPAWLTCLRFELRGHLRHYAIFIRGGMILEWRASVMSDLCHKESYTPLVIPGLAKKPGT